MGAYAAIREEKSRGSSGLGWVLSAALEEDAEEERGGDEDEVSGLLLAGAILRFLRRDEEWLNGRASEAAQGALLKLFNERREADGAEDRQKRLYVWKS
jgi:hypothetical protein